MSKILLVEDSKTISTLIKKRLNSQVDFEIDTAYSFMEALKKAKDPNNDYFIGLLDLNLPDAPNGEIVDEMLKLKVPSVVFTGLFNNELRKAMWSKGVIDYVMKEGQHNVDYLASLINRIYRNKTTKTLIVDDSRTARSFMAALLRVHQYEILEASDGYAALKVLEKNPDIKLVITDYNMPKMNGFELAKKIRENFSKDRLAIMGVSGTTNETLSAKFIKSGANDFINKPFSREEFYCRISQNVTIIENIAKMQETQNQLSKEIDERKLIELALVDKAVKVKNLLDNAGQGFLTFREDLLLENEYSAECLSIFGKKIENKPFFKAHLSQ